MSELSGNQLKLASMNQSWTWIAMCLLLFLIPPTDGGTATGCPERCVCASVAVVKCSQITTFPQNIPKDTATLTLSEFRFNDFPVQGMNEFKQLQSIHFLNGHFDRIGACAFDNIAGLDTFEMYNVSINTLDSYAFTNISDVTEIAIHNSRIGVIRSRAFNNVSSVKNIQMFQLNVTRIESYAFSNINSVSMFNFFLNSVKDMQPRAMYHFGTRLTLTISSSEFLKLGCQTVDHLIVQLGERVSFYENSISCGCQSAWMGRGESRDVLADFLKNTKCIGTHGTASGSSLPNDTLLQLTHPGFQEKCKDSDAGACTIPEEVTQSLEEACFERRYNQGYNTTAPTVAINASRSSLPSDALLNVTTLGFQEKCKDSDASACTILEELTPCTEEACFERRDTQGSNTTPATVNSASRVPLVTATLLICLIFHRTLI